MLSLPTLLPSFSDDCRAAAVAGQRMQAESAISRNPKTLAYTGVSKLTNYRIQRQENRYNLTCYSEHPSGSQSDSVILNVLYPPIVNVSKVSAASYHLQVHQSKSNECLSVSPDE